MWYYKPFLILAPPNILFKDNKKSFAKINLQRIYIFIIRQYFPISCLSRKNFYLPSWRFLPSIVNIIRYVKGSRNTACGHNDFCSVRLNGPIWWFILTHRYRLSLSQFTEAVMVESATGPLLLRKSRSLPTQKCHAPPAVAESFCLYCT